MSLNQVSQHRYVRVLLSVTLTQTTTVLSGATCSHDRISQSTHGGLNAILAAGWGATAETSKQKKSNKFHVKSAPPDISQSLKKHEQTKNKVNKTYRLYHKKGSIVESCCHLKALPAAFCQGTKVVADSPPYILHQELKHINGKKHLARDVKTLSTKRKSLRSGVQQVHCMRH